MVGRKAMKLNRFKAFNIAYLSRCINHHTNIIMFACTNRLYIFVKDHRNLESQDLT